MLNYKSSLQNTSYKTSKKDNSIFPTLNEFNTQNSLSSPKKETKSRKINDIRGNIQGIINDVAKKAADNRTAVETVSGINSQIIDYLNMNRSQFKPASIEYLANPQYQNGLYYNMDVAYSQSVGPYDSRAKKNLSQHNQKNYDNYQKNNFFYNDSFGSPIKNKSLIQKQYFSPAVYGSADKMRSLQKLPQDQTYYDDPSNFNYSYLKSPNGIIPEQSFDQFNRNDLILFSQTLRKRFNDEIRRNQAFYEKCQQLESQNAALRIASKKSSNGISQTKENESVLRSINNSGKRGFSGYPIDLLAQLQRLKQENDRLRKDTINLLRKN